MRFVKNDGTKMKARQVGRFAMMSQGFADLSHRRDHATGGQQMLHFYKKANLFLE
jgi:hypothetical protein